MYTEAQVVALVHQQRTINYVQVASATLWVYEWLILIPDEVSLVWDSNWSFMSYLYMWTRYSAIADIVLGLRSSLQVMSPRDCHISDSVNSFLILIGIYTSELVLLWRTFAIWGNNKYVKNGLGGLWLLMIPFDLYFVSSFVSSAVYGPQLLPGLPGCNLVHASPIDIGAFISLLVIESIIVALTIIKGVQNARLMYHGRLMPILIRDGILFFVCLLGKMQLLHSYY
ncbi:hypothetical protein BDY19DRAFT_415561 [Irpex rosettiformis]|uniref:Uncharacterized protein n=1 Tax=Irpex rosettiformis TaxID=378272 RepID=A0ACB8UGC7_9APHY|nr:hypothetical protein BDY19DRAFT_415561 [Irpex rosettiformis]